MKKWFVFAVLHFTINEASACEICGCSGNGYHLGILPQFKKHFIGVRNTYRVFNSQHLISEQLHILGKKSVEYFNTTEIWGRYQVGKKTQLFVLVPYNSFTQKEEGLAAQKVQGLGDISILANRILMTKNAGKMDKIQQTWQAGGGVKLPTGRYDSDNSDDLNANMNAGTGSFDILLNTIYTIRYNHFGLNADAGYRINTANTDEFRYGNRITTGARLFYWKNLGRAMKWSILPNIGILYDRAAKDDHHQEKQTYSGGSITNLVAGTEIYAGKWTLGASWFHPLQQDLSKGLVKMKSQVTINMAWVF